MLPIRNLILSLFVLSLFILATSCDRPPLKDITHAMRLSSPPIQFSDDLELQPLILGLEKHIMLFEKSPSSILTFGKDRFTYLEYSLALKFLLEKYQNNSSKELFLDTIKNNFNFYQVYGREDLNYGEIFLTSYYEPVIFGSSKKTSRFTCPLYHTPQDIVEINLGDFNQEDYGVSSDNPKRILGRLLKEKSPRGNLQVVPYYSRKEIDIDLSLEGKNLEICYVDPLDSFILQIQGSGSVIVDQQKRIRLGYAGQNGRKYISIGKFLLDKIPKEEMSLHKIESYLRSLPHNDMMNILNKNPSYVFFRQLDGRPITTIGTEVIDGRTIATDTKFFPKGALGFLIFNKPKFKTDQDYEPLEFVTTQRFVLDQDTGGAITGGGRADLFWGGGDIAKKNAGVIRHKAQLYYLAPKKELLSKLIILKNN